MFGQFQRPSAVGIGSDGHSMWRDAFCIKRVGGVEVIGLQISASAALWQLFLTFEGECDGCDGVGDVDQFHDGFSRGSITR